MSGRTIAVVMLALICGASVAVGVSRVNPRMPADQGSDAVPVLVAAADVPRGKTLSATDVVVRDWPKPIIPAGTLGKPEEVVDRVATSPLLAGEPILEGKLAAKNAGRGLTAFIPLGMRAYTIQTSRVASNVAGFILPGNKVDVLLNLKGRMNDETGGGSTTTLLQVVEVLAVDQRLEAPAENKVDPRELSSVTLLVTPKQAALLDLGSSMGQLTLSLRNLEDVGEAETEPATIAEIRYRQEKPLALSLAERNEEPPPPTAPAAVEAKPKPAAPATRAIVTLRGNHWGRVWINPEQR
jgi:pilus assembly protein CpaB